MNTLKELIPSYRLRIAAIVMGVLVVELLVFHAGVVVGSRDSEGPGFDRQWAFHPPGMGDIRMPHAFMLSGHGAVGLVQAATPTSVVLQTRDGAIKTIALASTTVIGGADSAGTSTALRPGVHIVVIGRPNPDGSIAADFIRILAAGSVPVQ